MTRITFASPAEPSGASWLINCLLELRIKVAHKPVVDAAWRHAGAAPDAMWQPAGDGTYRLHPRASVLKRFLPVLSRVETIRFRDDVEVEYVQDLGAPHHADRALLCFVRDPRDSLYSAYRRLQPGHDYDAFLHFPDPETLLDRPSQWRLWAESWLALPHGAWFTFEDYKRDAAALLRRILDELNIASTAEDVDRAVAESTFDKARRAEEQYRPRHAGDREVANRAGRVGEWTLDPEARAGAAFIESAAGAAMRRLGYESSTDDRSAGSAAMIPQLDRLRVFARDIDEDALRRTNLPNHRIHRLLESLERVARADAWESAPRLAALRGHFVEGSEHHFAQIRELLLHRRQGARPRGC